MRICFFVLLAIVASDNISLSQQKVYSDLRLRDKTFFLQDSAYWPEQEKSPALAGFLSFFPPGLALGQFENGQLLNGAIRVMVSLIAALWLINTAHLINIMEGTSKPGAWQPVAALALYAANWLSSVVDAVFSAISINKHIRLKNRYFRNQHVFDLNFGFDKRGVSFKAAVNF